MTSPISPEELKQVLNSHLRWLNSGGSGAERATLEDVNFGAAIQLRGADLRNATLNRAVFKGADLTETNFQDAELREASFDCVILRGANLQNALLGGSEFKNADLTDTKLQGADLLGAKLRNAILNGAEFNNAELKDAELQGAELRRANFDGAKLRGTNLRDADLQNANLENAEFLLTAQLAGANVAGAKLPEPIARFEGLKTIAEATSNGQKVFIAMLGGCLYSWLTIGTTKDVALLTNSASSPLPIIGTALPIVGFYILAPIVLLGIYFYFHLNMQRLWEALADLPAVFPDGRSLDKRADPWLLNGLVSAHFVRLRRERPALSRVQQWLSILLTWWIVPVTLFVFWIRFLVRHDWFGTALHIGVLTAAIGFGWMSYRLARATLRGMARKPFVWSQALRDRRTLKRVAGVLGTFAVGLVFYFVSIGAIEGISPDVPDPSNPFEIGSDDPSGYVFDPSATALKSKDLRRRVPLWLRAVGFSPFANLVEEDVSTRPLNWAGDSKVVKGARLRYANLQYADVSLAFLVNADLFGANLRSAYLLEANLSGADLSNARLEFTHLSGAKLANARLLNANVSNADLSNAHFERADLTGTDLSNAHLGNADLTGANLDGTIFTGADLRYTKGLTKRQIMHAMLNGAVLPDDLP